MPSAVVGLVGGAVLGVFARGWMRLLAEDPDFSWNGTLSIVVAFALFCALQQLAGHARTRWRPIPVVLARFAGVVSIMPLCVGAGALMGPTIVLGGLALARTDWPRLPRALCGAAGLIPAVFVVANTVSTFGVSLRALIAIPALLVTYMIIAFAVRASLAPQPDFHPTRNAKITAGIVATAAIAVPLLAGGIR